MGYMPRVQRYETRVSYLVQHGLVGEQSLNDCQFPPQADLENLTPFKAFSEDYLEDDFDPVRLNLEQQWDKMTSVENAIDNNPKIE